jgi:hypothetical protein
MTPELHSRYGLALFIALSLASAAGLSLLPAFDPVAALRPLAGAAGAGALLIAVAALGIQLTLRQLGRRVHPRWGSGALRSAGWLAWGLATGAWLMGGLQAPEMALRATPDGRPLLWLALTPLWLAAAGLWGRGAGSASSLRSVSPEGTPQLGPHRGVMDHLDVRRGLDVPRAGAGQQRTRRREDDVVAMAVDAEEQLVA